MDLIKNLNFINTLDENTDFSEILNKPFREDREG